MWTKDNQRHCHIYQKNIKVFARFLLFDILEK